jgi:hypothetical protein
MLAHREPVRVQVMRDQVRTGQLHVRSPGREPLAHLGQLGRQPRLGPGLPEPPPPVLSERRPPRLPLCFRRVHRHPVIQLHHHTTRTTSGAAGAPGDAACPRAGRRFFVLADRRGDACPAASCIISVLALVCANARCTIDSHSLHFRR